LKYPYTRRGGLKMKKRYIILSCILVFAFLMTGFVVPDSHASSRQMNEEEMSRLATHIVIGKVTDTKYVREKGGIFTYATISVRQFEKGKGAEKITVKVLGGVVDNIGCFSPDLPRFQKGEMVKLFLRRKGEIFKIVGGRCGKKRIGIGAAPIETVPQSTYTYRVRRYLYTVYLDWTYMEEPMGEDILINEEFPLDAQDRITAAANEWNTTGRANFQFTFGEPTSFSTISTDQPDGFNVVCHVQLDEFGTNVLALTLFWFYTDTGDIIEADCGVDVDPDWYVGSDSEGIPDGSFDLQGIMTHELGHYLSLEDVYDDYEDDSTGFPVTMYGYASPGYNETNTGKRTLEPADINGIQAIYGERTDVYDVAVTAIEAPEWVLQGDVVPICVTVQNEGAYSESFDVSLSDTPPPEGDPGTVTEPQSIALEPGKSSILTFSWNTMYATLGDHVLEAVTGTVLGETDTADNSMKVTVTVLETEPVNLMHVHNIAMSTESGRLRRYIYTNAVATVTIVDVYDDPVEGARVSGHWSGLTSDTDSGETDADGKVVLRSDRVRNASGTFIFTVGDVALADWTYYPDADLETSDSITVP